MQMSPTILEIVDGILSKTAEIKALANKEPIRDSDTNEERAFILSTIEKKTLIWLTTFVPHYCRKLPLQVFLTVITRLKQLHL